MKPDNPAINDFFNVFLSQLGTLGRAAENGIVAYSLDVNNETNVRERIEYWQRHVGEAQKSLDEIKNLGGLIFGESEKYPYFRDTIKMVPYIEGYIIPRDGNYLVRTRSKMGKENTFQARCKRHINGRDSVYTTIDVNNQIVTHISEQPLK